ncbi:MAG: membrane protein insertion efficiency factor YidD [Acidobacteria bacterium]|nr:membrane protein insertion efficiency factor YidD [Acidobacteriota bacterium]
MPVDPFLESPRAATGRAGTGARVALGLIRTYQLLFSWMYAGSCRFMPSCSHYAAESIHRFGVLTGTGLALRRLIRCHPFGAHGVDPVPDVARSELRRGGPERRSA